MAGLARGGDDAVEDGGYLVDCGPVGGAGAPGLVEEAAQVGMPSRGEVGPETLAANAELKFLGVHADEGLAHDEEFPGDDGERVAVGLEAVFLAHRDLWGHVAQGAGLRGEVVDEIVRSRVGGGGALRLVVVLDEFVVGEADGEAEVEELDALAVLDEADVLGLEVAVHDEASRQRLARVEEAERLGELRDHLEPGEARDARHHSASRRLIVGLVEPQDAARVGVAPFQQSARQAVESSDADDAVDERVRESSEQVHLALEGVQLGLELRQLHAQGLNRDLGPAVLGGVHDRLRPRPDSRQLPQLRAIQLGHLRRLVHDVLGQLLLRAPAAYRVRAQLRRARPPSPLGRREANRDLRVEPPPTLPLRALRRRPVGHQRRRHVGRHLLAQPDPKLAQKLLLLLHHFFDVRRRHAHLVHLRQVTRRRTRLTRVHFAPRRSPSSLAPFHLASPLLSPL
mmetsp:Transcript_6693/g.20365  ORF Transcript_6693/g.20365 Transcript_6693/m.20365 type:complete len:455 (+) Transcript_6693:375-1739(+)